MTQWAGVVPIEIQCGREGLWGIANTNLVPIGGAITLRNAIMSDHTWRVGGGAQKFGVPIGGTPLINHGIDFWPTPALQRTVVSTADGQIYKDDGTGNAWASLKAGLSTASPYNPFMVLGGAEAAGRNRKMFYCDGRNVVQVMSGDAAATADIALPPADWAGTNQPSGLAVHQGRLFGWGNPNNPHTLYYSNAQTGGQYMEDFQGGDTGVFPVFTGEGQYISCAISFKGGLMVWKYPQGVYFLDTTTIGPAPSQWTLKKVGNPGASGPNGAVLLENDVLWVAPDGSYHLGSATYAIGSVHASDIAYRKLGQYNVQNFNLGMLSSANLIYYTQKREVHLSIPGLGSTSFDHRLVLDLNREQDQGERWLTWDRDINPSIFMRRGTNTVPAMVMGDDKGQVWLLDQGNRDKNGQGYAFEFFLADTDFSQFVPQWAGKWKNLRYLQIEWVPGTTGNLNIEIYRDGVLSQTFTQVITGGGLVLPFNLPGIFGPQTLQNSNKRQLLGRCRRLSIRGTVTQTDADISISRLIVGVEVGE
jgi:hypothetical protein